MVWGLRVYGYGQTLPDEEYRFFSSHVVTHTRPERGRDEPDKVASSLDV
jgi:hypothetical protein